MRLELAFLKTLLRQGKKFEQGNVYDLPDEEARALLRTKDDRGIPLFKLVTGEPKVQPQPEVATPTPVVSTTTTVVRRSKPHTPDAEAASETPQATPVDDGVVRLPKEMTGVRLGKKKAVTPDVSGEIDTAVGGVSL